MRHPPRFRWRWLIVSLAFTAVVAALAARVALPHVYRWQMLSRLTSPDPLRREAALNYVLYYAARDARVRDGVIARLAQAGDANFLELVDVLERAGQWRRPVVPVGPWLRRLALLLGDREPGARMLALERLGELGDLAGDARVLDLLDRGLGDAEPDVRYDAVLAAARLAGFTRERSRHESLLARATADAHPAVARQAWLFLGLLDPASGVRGNWRQAPPAVAAAMLWASLHTNPDHPAPALEALRDPQADPHVRAMAAYLLHELKPAVALDAVRQLLGPADRPDFLANLRTLGPVVVWRAVLATPLRPAAEPPEAPPDAALVAVLHRLADLPVIVPPPSAETRPSTAPNAPNLTTRPAATAVDPADAPPATPNPKLETRNPRLPSSWYPVTLAARYRLAGLLAPPAAPQLAGHAPMEQLALLEGLPADRFALAIDPDMPDLVRLAAVAAAKDPKADDLLPLFASDAPTVRDLACVLAARRFTKDQNDELVNRLLRLPYLLDDDNKRSAAILAGLTGVAPQRLAKKTADEDVATVREIMTLGLWMQGQHVEGDMTTRIQTLLARPDMPRTTILLALLHRQPRTALDYLLDERGNPQFTLGELAELLGQYRWWQALRPHLPADAPPFWTWADPGLQEFQCEVLRGWYLLRGEK